MKEEEVSNAVVVLFGDVGEHFALVAAVAQLGLAPSEVLEVVLSGRPLLLHIR